MDYSKQIGDINKAFEHLDELELLLNESLESDFDSPPIRSSLLHLETIKKTLENYYELMHKKSREKSYNP
jgi:hypothetical protein